VRAAVHRQVDQLWSVGRWPTPPLHDALAAATSLLPAGMRMAGLYSTGMEGMEFALRVASLHTGRRGLVAFARSMHGKSALTAGLAWPQGAWRPDALQTLPFVGSESPAAVLDRLADTLTGGDIAALVVEPVQGSNGGHAVDAEWLAAAQRLCHAHGTLLVLDEILTGLFRTGPAFVSTSLTAAADLLVFGKCMANGLPVSGVALRDSIGVPAAALPGSTFAGNAVVAAAAAATLRALAAPGTVDVVLALEAAWRDALAPLPTLGITVRGRGALVLIELADDAQARAVEAALQRQAVLVAGSGRWIRLLPSLACTPAQLHEACSRLVRSVRGTV
jgi:4-aminobutyrate aminotransferase/(S)-3-amino-2-methylpropionate transaminase/5-aminovalerate/4-aminobutyrate aminotransferase